MSEPIDTETISTVAGDYTVSWYHDEDSESPLIVDGARAFYLSGGRDASPYEDTLTSVSHAGDMVAEWIVDHYGDVDAITRRFAIWQAISGSTWRLFTGSGSGAVQSHWWNYFLLIDSAEYTDPDSAARAIMDEYQSWASGDVYGYHLTGPDGALVDSCSSFIGDAGQRSAMVDYIRPAIDRDVADRVTAANAVGAGFVGVI